MSGLSAGFSIESEAGGGIGGAARTTLSGALTFATAEAAYQAGLRALGSPVAGVRTFDFGGVADADSAGLAVLLDWRREALVRGVELCFENVPDSIARLARISGVEPLLVGDSVTAA